MIKNNGENSDKITFQRSKPKKCESLRTKMKQKIDFMTKMKLTPQFENQKWNFNLRVETND